jgi:hypothetical protein
MAGVLANNSGQSTPKADAAVEKNGAHVEFNEQTNYVPKRTIITVSVPRSNMATKLMPPQIFLACSTVDLLALMDQTTLAASLSIIGNALGASDQTSWISGGYFVYALPRLSMLANTDTLAEHQHVSSYYMANFLTSGLASWFSSSVWPSSFSGH